MLFVGINYLAVLAAAAGAFFFGFLFYSTLAKPWMAATGKSEESLKTGGMVKPMAVSILSHLVMSYMLAGIMGHLGPDRMSITGGLITGFFVWVGFGITIVAVNYAWQRANPMLTVIDGAHWLGVLLVQGLIIGAIAV